MGRARLTGAMRRGALGLGVCAILWAAAAPAAAEPTWWFTVGGHAAIETGRLSEILGTEGSIRLGGGLYLFRLGPVLVGADAEVTAGRRNAHLGTATDKIDVYRGRLGVRASWWHEDDEPRWVPYARVGAVYRTDRGDFIKDDGVGWYVSLGLDIRLNETWSFGPFVSYEAISLSVETESFLFGFGFTFSY